MSLQRPFIIGLTGGIACGKSTISAYLQKKGIPVVDGDIVARQIVAPNTVGLSQIIEVFGSSYLQEDGGLNRAKLGDIVFHDEEALQRLNAITKPLLLQAFQEQIRALQQYPVIVLDVALLLEDAAYRDLVDVVWLVTTTAQQQRERLMQRNHYTAEEAQSRIDAQMCDAERRKLADVIIDNSGTIAETERQVDRLLLDV